MSERKKVNKKQINKLCRYWQNVLRLQDWKVNVVFKPFRDMGDCCLGMCKIHEESRSAEIWLIEPGEESPTAIPEYEVEQTLIHELLHILFWKFKPKSWKNANGIAQEQAINAISDALFALKQSWDR